MNQAQYHQRHLLVDDSGRVDAELRRVSETSYCDTFLEDTHRVRDEIVDKPGEGDANPLLPVAADDEPVGRRATSQCVLLEVFRLLHAQTPHENEGGRDAAETKR